VPFALARGLLVTSHDVFWFLASGEYEMITKTLKRSLIGALFATTALAAATAPVKADLIFDLNTSNGAGSVPFAQVDVHLVDPTDATITFTSLTNGGNIFLLGGNGAVGVNVNGSFTLGTITGSNSGTGFTPGPYSPGGAGNEDGFGSFNLTINSFDGFTHSSDTVSFALTAVGTTWLTANDVLTANALGNLAAAHIFVTASPAVASNGASFTGFASGTGGGGNVPEPVSLLLFGTGLLGLGVMARRKGLI
jgi:hypothetical protein